MKKNLTDARSFAGTLKNSDHRLVRANLDFQIKPIRKYSGKKINKFYTNLLQDEETKAKFQAHADQLLSNNKKNPPSTPQAALDNINTTLLEAAKETLPPIIQKHANRFSPEIEKLSKQQKEIRLSINNTNNDETNKKLKAERNKLLHQIKVKSLENANNRIDNLVEEIQNCNSGSAQMYQDVKAIFRKPTRPITVKNKEGALVENDNEKARILKDYFSEKYNGTRIEPFTKKGELNNPITPEEVRKALASLSNNKAPGPDGIQVELLKSAPPSVIEELAETFNNTFIQGQTTNIGNGTLILLQKPGKPTGPPANLRPTVLLPVARKILSLITFNRMKEKVDSYLSPSQAGFRQNRSTAGIAWSRWNLFGHILRHPIDIPANLAMKAYFDPSNKPGCRGKSPINLPKLLDEDLEIYEKPTTVQNQIIQLDHCYQHRLKLKTNKDLDRLIEIAQNRDNWKVMAQQIAERRQAETRQPTN
ncbi:endonuclease-reverse transcriptase [Elysia marginata]|uniref:Endonuclease-reverse transcriptase n=1 Tax=Elysia marginata TaxID=1093978 RepID=A0AAV4ESD4_9GAST|nr:endonuclease-reverse transcriptase [Elysia marginata]